MQRLDGLTPSLHQQSGLEWVGTYVPVRSREVGMFRRSVRWVVLALGCAGCAPAPPAATAPLPPALPAATSIVISPSGAVVSTASAAARQSGSSLKPTATGSMVGDCPANEPFIDSLRSVSKGATTVTGVARATGRHATAMQDSFATGDPMVFTELSVQITSQLIGPHLPDRLTVQLDGGQTDGRSTEVSATLESAWAVDGAFFGTVVPSPAFPGQYTMEVMPLVGSAITFAGTGCRRPVGLAVTRRLTTVVMMDDGNVHTVTGTFATADLDVVEKLLR